MFSELHHYNLQILKRGQFHFFVEFFISRIFKTILFGSDGIVACAYTRKVLEVQALGSAKCLNVLKKINKINFLLSKYKNTQT